MSTCNLLLVYCCEIFLNFSKKPTINCQISFIVYSDIRLNDLDTAPPPPPHPRPAPHTLYSIILDPLMNTNNIKEYFEFKNWPRFNDIPFCVMMQTSRCFFLIFTGH